MLLSPGALGLLLNTVWGGRGGGVNCLKQSCFLFSSIHTGRKTAIGWSSKALGAGLKGYQVAATAGIKCLLGFNEERGRGWWWGRGWW